MKRLPGPCRACGAQIIGKSSWAWYCDLCGKAKRAVARELYEVIFRRMHRKRLSDGLPPATDLACVDCGSRASFYEHRDYFKPLEIEPVCGGCNLRRGPALTLLNNVQHYTITP